MTLTRVATDKVLVPSFDIPNRKGGDKAAFVIAAIELPGTFQKRDTCLIHAHTQLSNPGSWYQLQAVGVYACSSFVKGKEFDKRGEEKIIETMGQNIAPKQHHDPSHLSETFELGSKRVIVIVAQGNVRSLWKSGKIIVNEAFLSVTRLG